MFLDDCVFAQGLTAASRFLKSTHGKEECSEARDPE